MLNAEPLQSRSIHPDGLPLGYNVRAYGAKGDGHALDTDAINRAVAAAGAAGGGTVLFPAGEYLSHSIRLQSNVTIVLGPGATLIAADPPTTGKAPGYDAPEPSGTDHYQDFGHTHFQNSLVWGVGLENVGIIGPGRIYGRGLSRGNGTISLPVGHTAPHDPNRLPDVLEADGPVQRAQADGRPPGPFGYPNVRDTLPAGVGNKAIALKGCRNIILRDFALLHGGHFAILLAGCDNVTVDNLLIDTNRDGMDIDACANVRVSNCSVNSPWDDGICLKASMGSGTKRPVENVTITNCYVSGFLEGSLLDGTRQRVINQRGGPMGRIKLGTEAGGGFRNITISNCVFEFCRGLALEQVDGGVMEDIAITNITMRDIVNAPLFIRLGARLMAPGATEPGKARRILVSNVVAHNIDPAHGIFIAGLPEHPVTDTTLENLQLYYRGGGVARSHADFPEMPRGYPEPLLFGTLPAWGLYARHAKGLQVRNVRLRALEADPRPAVVLDDVSASDFTSVDLGSPGMKDGWLMHAVTSVRAIDCTGLPDRRG